MQKHHPFLFMLSWMMFISQECVYCFPLCMEIIFFTSFGLISIDLTMIKQFKTSQFPYNIIHNTITLVRLSIFSIISLKSNLYLSVGFVTTIEPLIVASFRSGVEI
jgi:hypothetical protein